MGFTEKKNPEITEPKVLENWEKILGKDQDIVIYNLFLCIHFR